METAVPGRVELEAVLPAQRERLIRLCAHLSGEAGVAEDLAQETMVEAWRHADRLHEADGSMRWLSAIARNVCLRWRRQRGREQTRLFGPGSGQTAHAVEDLPVDGVDLEVELERSELAELLDRAMALLPPETRAVLIERFVEELPKAEVAARLGVSEGVVAVRVHRGKLALRRLLTTDLAHEAASYGWFPPSGTWQETRIWCPGCGRRRLMGRFDRGESDGKFMLRCLDCDREPGVYMANVDLRYFGEELGSVKGYKPALSRMMTWVHDYYGRAAIQSSAPCHSCGRSLPLQPCLPEDGPPSLRGLPGAHLRCDACSWRTANGLGLLVLNLPAVRGFWKEHPRMQLLPSREVETLGHAAMVTGYQSLTGNARIDVLSEQSTCRVLSIHGA